MKSTDPGKPRASDHPAGEAQSPRERSGLRKPTLASVKRWLREPLLFFLVLGAATFAVYAAVNPGSGGSQSSKRIELTTEDLRQLEIAFLAQWNRPPTPQEAAGILEMRIHEEVLYREALALGLDKQDTIVRRRMAALADRFMFQDYYGDRSPEQLGKEFGQKFALALFKLKPGSWQGPIESGFGWHLIWINSISPMRVPAFEEVEADVKDAWTKDWQAEVQSKAYETMRAQYEIVLPRSAATGIAHPKANRMPAAVNEVQ
jgi:parvulin-like peptidyl-prolyl cis-trans isomerase-like protein